MNLRKHLNKFTTGVGKRDSNNVNVWAENKGIVSKLTKRLSGKRITVSYTLVNDSEFFTKYSVCPRLGLSRPSRYFTTSYIGDPMVLTIGQSRQPDLWTLGGPYSHGEQDVLGI